MLSDHFDESKHLHVMLKHCKISWNGKHFQMLMQEFVYHKVFLLIIAYFSYSRYVYLVALLHNIK
jgi:hypothetical protein